MEQPREVVTLSRVSCGRYLVRDSKAPVELQLARWRSRGSAIVGTQRYELRRAGILDRRVAMLDQTGNEVLGLSRKHPNLPGLADCQWRVRSRLRGYEAQLTGAGVDLVVRIGHRAKSDVTAHITGALPNRDLVVVAAAFAVLARRREDTDAGAAAASTAAVSG